MFSYSHGSDNSSSLTINTNSRDETVIAIDSQTHVDYGLSYPVTYEFNIPSASNDLMSYRRFKSEQEWSQIIEKTSNDFFNGIEAVRFDYGEDIARDRQYDPNDPESIGDLMPISIIKQNSPYSSDIGY